jgi:hypothetical protein
MNYEQIRLECLKLAATIETNDLFKTADSFVNYVYNIKQKTEKTNTIDFIEKNFKLIKQTKSYPFNLYEHQIDIISAIDNNKITVINHARQIGVTTTIASYILQQCLNKDNFKVFIGSHKFADAINIIDIIKDSIESTIDVNEMFKHVKEYSKNKIIFKNNSSIISTVATPQNIKGLSVNLIWIDNAAFVSHNIFEEFMRIISPELSNMKLILSSIPNKKEGVFYNMFNNNDILFKKLKLSYKVMNRDEDWINQYKIILGDKFKQEMENEFIE